MGKVEEDPPYLRFSENYLPWHGHVTALTIAPQYRRLGLAKSLTGALERGCDEQHAWFVDLFVREGNDIAVGLYRSLGLVVLELETQSQVLQSISNPKGGGHRYSVFRRVLKYYSDDPTGGKAGEDAFDMRKPLRRDKKLQHVRVDGENHAVYPEDLYHG
jgi:N-terminal acetyltransferase B complex catalytic subunit